MADTIRERCVAAVVAAIETLGGVTVLRNADREADWGDGLTVNVTGGGHVVQGPDGTTDSNEEEFLLNIEADCLAPGNLPELAEQALNALYGRVKAVVVADRTLGGVATDVRELAFGDPEMLGEEGAPSVAAAAITFEIIFATAEGDPTSLPY